MSWFMNFSGHNGWVVVHEHFWPHWLGLLLFMNLSGHPGWVCCCSCTLLATLGGFVVVHEPFWPHWVGLSWFMNFLATLDGL